MPNRIRAAAFIVSAIVALGAVQGVARAGSPAVGADPDLSSSVDFSGTGPLVATVSTPALRRDAASGAAPRILLLGTGVQRALFPAGLQPSIQGSGADLTDTHGYGTLAASTIFQLLPDATITSKHVPAYDASWHLLNIAKLAGALEEARANRSAYDLVLLAFPPNAALDPVSHSIGHGNYGPFGKGMAMVEEALLSTRSGGAPIAGIPSDKALRDRVFAKANLKQRDAVERFAAQAIPWRRVLRALDELSESGVAVVAPAGDFTRKSNGVVAPLVTQTVFGVAALPSVITVGASYGEVAVQRLSPMSGRGPTLALGAKPDVLAPSNVMAMLPAGARLPWPDDSARMPLQMLEWAKPGVAATPCPSLQSVYRCVLQGSSMVSAAVVAANLSTLVAGGMPHPAGARASLDDEALRGIAWAQASSTSARALGEERAAYSWEQGVGVFTGLARFDAAQAPIALARAEFGEVDPGVAKSVTLPLWSGGAQASSARASLASLLGADPSGAAVAKAHEDPTRVTASTDGARATLSAIASDANGGYYGGTATLTSSNGTSSTLVLSLIQDVSIDFTVNYAYNSLLTGGAEGERVEDASVALFAGLPTNVGLIGEAFKNFSSTQFRRFGGDPTNSVVIRYGTTKNSFTDPSVPAAEHGRGHIDAIPPGFYRLHVMSDHEVEAQQARGRTESVGIRLATSGPEAAVAPGANLLIAATPPDRTKFETDPDTGLCVARNSSTQVAFGVYCGAITYAVPTAMISRAVHLVGNDEWQTCGVDVPMDGKPLDFAAMVTKARSCSGQTVPTAWSFTPKAPDCLAPSERSAHPDGHAADTTATYDGVVPSGVPGRNLPVGVLSYEFKLPWLNTYTTAGLSLSYKAENALIGVRFKTGSDPAGDSSNGLLVVDDPDVTVQPALQAASARGTAFAEWTVMSANAASGTISLIVIPTSFRGVRVQLCDVALRVSTFAKQTWGRAALEDGVPTQYFPMLDRGLTGQIAGVSRVRAKFDGTSFRDAGAETEALHFATQIPKNTTTSKVRSPRGGPAYLKAVRRWGTDARRYGSVLPVDFKAHDPAYGTTLLSCSENSLNPAEAETCRLFNAARAGGGLLADLTPQMSVNGRFSGVLAIDHAAVARGAGNVAFEIADADDAGAFASRWSGARSFPVGNFYDDVASPWSLALLSGIVSVARDAAGSYVMGVRADGVAGVAHTITATMSG